MGAVYFIGAGEEFSGQYHRITASCDGATWPLRVKPGCREVALNRRIASDEPQIADQIPSETAIVGMCQERR
jgi:hypothetical protein